MKRLSVFIILFISLTSISHALSGREIIDKSDELKSFDTAYSEVEMLIHYAGDVVEKSFKSESIKLDDDNSMSLIKFVKPSKTEFLTHSYKNKSDDQWLKMSSGRVKRITSALKAKSFVGSDFSYEDLSTRNIDDYKYKLLGSENVAGEDCYKVESIKINGEKVYSKTILYPRKSDYFVKRIDFYEKGKFKKYLVNYKIKKIRGILTPAKVVMSQTRKKAKTVLKLKKIAYNIDINKSKFNKEAFR